MESISAGSGIVTMVLMAALSVLGLILVIMWIVFPWLVHDQLTKVRRELVQANDHLAQINLTLHNAYPPKPRWQTDQPPPPAST